MNETTMSTGSDRPQAPIHAPAKILIVDDEREISEEIADLLTYEGHECLTAHDAYQALDMIQADPAIGVVVTDIRMPGMDGLAMAKVLKEDIAKRRDLYMIVITGHAGMQEAIDALKIGAEDFITKPISPDYLIHSVTRAEELLKLRQQDRTFREMLEREVAAKTRDLTKMTNKLIRANEVKDQFMSMMGHELRTPLNAIKGFSELLKILEEQKGDEQAVEYLDLILRSSHRLETTIENILEYSTAFAGGRKPVIAPCVGQDLLQHAVTQTADYARMRRSSLVIAANDPSVTVMGDPRMLDKALICLIDNAIKFSPTDSTVTVGLTPQADDVVLSVQDNGCGMSEEQIALAREPMAQVDGSLSRPAEGSGMGLPLAILLVELQGGRVEIESAPGRGTTVNIVMPIHNDMMHRPH